MYHLTKSDIANVEGFEFHKISKLELEFNDKPNANWCLDGEKYDEINEKYNIDIIRNVKLLLPKKNINKLFKK